MEKDWWVSAQPAWPHGGYNKTISTEFFTKKNSLYQHLATDCGCDRCRMSLGDSTYPPCARGPVYLQNGPTAIHQCPQRATLKGAKGCFAGCTPSHPCCAWVLCLPHLLSCLWSMPLHYRCPLPPLLSFFVITHAPMCTFLNFLVAVEEGIRRNLSGHLILLYFVY